MSTAHFLLVHTFTLVILSILILPSTLAVGLSAIDLTPSFDYQPGLIRTYAYRLNPTVNTPMDYYPTIQGDLAEYTQIIPPEFKQLPPNEKAWFTVVIRFPNEEAAVPPGIHELRLGVSETPPAGSQIGASTGVTIPIRIRVLYPEAYLVSSLNAHDTGINQPAPIDLGLSNWGRQPINTASATITVTDATNQTFGQKNTETISIPSSEGKTISALLDTFGYKPGSYNAFAAITWDGNSANATDTFRIGVEDLKLIAYSTTFQQGAINPFTIDVESAWNNPLSQVYAEITLGNKKLTTPTTWLNPFEQKRLTTYWDLTNHTAGRYEGELTLYYDGNSKKKSLSLTVSENAPLPTIQQPTKTSSPLLTFIFLIVILNIILWAYIYIKKRSNEQ